jgi:NhaP-type Na+/H+ or K+/H+ antiporter
LFIGNKINRADFSAACREELNSIWEILDDTLNAVLFVLIGLLSEWIRRHVKLPFEWNDSGNLTDDEYSRLKRIFFVVMAACLINPQTFEGAFYPNNKEELNSSFDYFNDLIKQYFSEKIYNKDVKALIVPHAGYVYSGFTANLAY